MTAIAKAIERKEWRLVSLYLLLGVTEAAAQLPPESFVALMELLVESEPPRKGRHAR